MRLVRGKFLQPYEVINCVMICVVRSLGYPVPGNAHREVAATHDRHTLRSPMEEMGDLEYLLSSIRKTSFNFSAENWEL